MVERPVMIWYVPESSRAAVRVVLASALPSDGRPGWVVAGVSRASWYRVLRTLPTGDHGEESIPVHAPYAATARRIRLSLSSVRGLLQAADPRPGLLRLSGWHCRSWREAAAVLGCRRSTVKGQWRGGLHLDGAACSPGRPGRHRLHVKPSAATPRAATPLSLRVSRGSQFAALSYPSVLSLSRFSVLVPSGLDTTSGARVLPCVREGASGIVAGSNGPDGPCSMGAASRIRRAFRARGLDVPGVVLSRALERHGAARVGRVAALALSLSATRPGERPQVLHPVAWFLSVLGLSAAWPSSVAKRREAAAVDAAAEVVILPFASFGMAEDRYGFATGEGSRYVSRCCCCGQVYGPGEGDAAPLLPSLPDSLAHRRCAALFFVANAGRVVLEASGGRRQGTIPAREASRV